MIGLCLCLSIDRMKYDIYVRNRKKNVCKNEERNDTVVDLVPPQTKNRIQRAVLIQRRQAKAPPAVLPTYLS